MDAVTANSLTLILKGNFEDGDIARMIRLFPGKATLKNAVLDEPTRNEPRLIRFYLNSMVDETVLRNLFQETFPNLKVFVEDPYAAKM